MSGLSEVSLHVVLSRPRTKRCLRVLSASNSASKGQAADLNSRGGTGRGRRAGTLRICLGRMRLRVVMGS
jgi:hypothetical protein